LFLIIFMLESQQNLTSKILCCLEGSIENQCLTTKTGEIIKIRGNCEFSGAGIWLCIPATDSSAELSSVSIVSKAESRQESYCVGRVTQVAKRGTILVKVSNSCKVTFVTKEILDVSGVYRLEFNFSDGRLHVVKATRLDNDNQSVEAQVIEQKVEVNVSAAKNTVNTAPTSVELLWRQKLEPLILERIPGIKFTDFNIHTGVLEWEGAIESKKYRIQGTVGSTNLNIFEFNNYKAPVVDDDFDEDEDEENEEDVLKVTPLGAARSIGASCFKVEIGKYEIVLDAGTRPKGDNPLPAFELLKNPNLILITHAHSDHIGALPVLHRMFKATPMICTLGTRHIARVMLEDCLKVNLKNEDFEPIFEEEDLQQTLLHLETQPIGVEFEPLPGLTVKFINAGHIVGAACIYLKYGNRSLVYTGDYHIANSRTTIGLKLADLPTADILITEATYGAAVHPSRKQQEAELVQAVWDVVGKGGNVLIPAFALGRAQEIILLLKTSSLFSNSDIPIYVDGLVRKVTDVFNDNLELLPEAISNFAANCRIPPFCDGKKVIFINDTQERPFAMAKPSVIIASSGMLTGGASIYYAKALLERDNASIFISGYTDEESPGRLLQSMKSGEVVTLDGIDYTVKAEVRKFNLSAHTDRIGIGQVIAKVAPRHLILIHGIPDTLYDLARTDLQKNHVVHIPHCGETIEYGVFPDFLSQKRQVEIEHPKEVELEIVAEHDGAWIRIPQEVVDTDPRWQTLSQIGIIRAKWHRDSLMLMPITNKQIPKKPPMISMGNCCARCKYFDGSLCLMPDSIFHNRQIAPEGSCPEFTLKS
jgi:uncharacterized protein